MASHMTAAYRAAQQHMDTACQLAGAIAIVWSGPTELEPTAQEIARLFERARACQASLDKVVGALVLHLPALRGKA